MLTRVIAILLVLLLLPTAAFALTYSELVVAVRSATTNQTFTLTADVDQVWGDPNFEWLENYEGVTITIDATGRTVTGLGIWAGIYEIIGGTFVATDTPEYTAGIEMWNFGEVVSLTLDHTVDLDSTLGSALFFVVEDGGVFNFVSSTALVNDDAFIAVNGEQIFVDELTVDEYGNIVLSVTAPKWEDQEEGTPPEPRPERQVVNKLVGSPYYLYRLYLTGMSYDVRLYDGDGNKVAFRQRLVNVGGGDTLVGLQTTPMFDELGMGITVGALKRLVNVARVTVLRVTNGRAPADFTFVDYDTGVLLALALAAGLDDDVELYLTGADDDIMIRTVDAEGNVTLTKIEDALK